MTGESEGPTATTNQPRDIPGRLGRSYVWLLRHWPTSTRRRIAVVVVGILFVLAAIPMLARLGGVVVDLGILPYAALMLLCWVGEGGLLVPIPGVRLLSFATIVQQGGNLEPALVAALAAVAMALGQSSYFTASRSGERIAQEHRGSGEAPADPAVDVEVAQVGRSRRLIASGRQRAARAGATIAHRMRSRPGRTIFALSVLPSPLTTLGTVTAASAGVPFRQFFVASLAGFLVLSAVLAFAGQAILAALGR